MMRHLIYTCCAMVMLAVVLPSSVVAQMPEIEQTRRKERLFDRHVVRMGETAFSIARGYAISPLTLAADNPDLDLTRVSVGQVLFVRKRERGKTEPAQVALEWQQMTGEKSADPMVDTATAPSVGAMSEASDYLPRPDTLWSPLGDGGGTMHYRRMQGQGLWARDFSSGGTPHIALMLPLSGAVGDDFIDFYKGAMLALENLKAQGRSAIVTIYDSERSADKVRHIVTSQRFADTDLIIGPVYENELEPAVRFGESFGVPVVSPLAATRELDSEVLYQMAPDPVAKYDKLRELLSGDVNVIVVSSGASDDSEFAGEMTSLLETNGVVQTGSTYRRFTIGQGEIAPLIDWERPNVLVVLAGDESAVNMALATVSSSYNKASATRSRRAEITVVGTSKWVGYNSTTDLANIFFKLNTRFVTSYYINRSDNNTRLFETRYLEVYGDFPTRSALRGYDAVTLFAGALFETGLSFTERLERVGTTPLGTAYRFVRGGGTLRHVNDQWTLVSFTSDYNISAR